MCISQIDKSSPPSKRSGGWRSLEKRLLKRLRRRLGKRMAHGDEKAEGKCLTQGWTN